jgi:hypothetical protein
MDVYKRETPAWRVLTDEESNRNDYFTYIVFTFVLLLILAIAYLL